MMIKSEQPKFKTFSRNYKGNAHQAGMGLQKEMELNESTRIDNELQDRQSSMKNFVSPGARREQEARLTEAYHKSLSQVLLESAVADIYIQALPIDEHVKIEKRPQLLQYVSESFQQEFGTDAAKTMKKFGEKSEFLHILCEAVKEKVSQKVKEQRQAQTLENRIESITDCDNSVKIDVESKLGVQEVTNVIKDKVTKVVADEIKAQEEQQQLVQDIAGAKSLNESARLIPKAPVEEFTMFKSMMIHNHKESLSEAMQAEGGTDYVNLNESGAYSVDMEMILAESIMQYTMMETFYTLRMSDYSRTELQEKAHKLAYGKKIG